MGLLASLKVVSGANLYLPQTLRTLVTKLGGPLGVADKAVRFANENGKSKEQKFRSQGPGIGFALMGKSGDVRAVRSSLTGK